MTGLPLIFRHKAKIGDFLTMPQLPYIPAAMTRGKAQSHKPVNFRLIRWCFLADIKHAN